MMLKWKDSAQLWFPLTLLVVVPILLLNVAIGRLLSSLRQDAESAYLESMNLAAYYLDELLADNRDLIWQLSANPDIHALDEISSDKSLNDYTKILQANKARQNIFINEGKQDFAIILGRGNLLLTANGICHDLEKFYGSTYQIADFTYHQLLEQIQSNHMTLHFFSETTVRLDGQERRGILCQNPISSFYQGAAFILLDAEQLDRILSPLCTADGFCYITDKQGALLYQFGGDEKSFHPAALPNAPAASQLDEQLYGGEYATAHISLVSGLHIVSINPQYAAYKNVYFMQEMLWLANAACILVCTALAWLLVVRRTKRLRAALELLSPPQNEERTNLYNRVADALTSLLHENHALSDTIFSHRSIIQNLFWEQLLQGQIREEEALQNLAEKAGLNFGKCCCLLFIAFEPAAGGFALTAIKESERSRDTLLRQMQNIPAVGGLVYPIGMQQAVVVVKMDEKQKGIYKEIVCETLACVGSFLEQSGVCAIVGTPSSNISDLYNHYTVCKNHMNSFVLREKPPQGIIWCDNMPVFADNWYFPYELETRLVSGIRSGEYEIVKECFRSLLTGNFVSRSISPAMNDLLLSRLKWIVLSVYDSRMDFLFEDMCRQMTDLRTEAAQISYLLKVCQKMCAFYQLNREEEPDLRQKILEYIRLRLGDTSLSLPNTASFFHFSESYFSRLFKGMVGETFSSYVERLRMEEADRLLLETDLKVEDVTLWVSYVNVGSFRRAYKRHIGIPPSQRRE